MQKKLVRLLSCMKIVSFFIILLTCFGCSAVFPKREKLSSRERVVARIYKEFGSYMRDQGFVLIGTSSGINHATKKQNFMGMDFHTSERLSVVEARKLIVKYENEFIKKINEDQEILPYLDIVPYDHKHTSLFISGNTVFSEEGCISSVSAYEGKVTYMAIDPLGNPKRIVLLRETFEEAECILAEQSTSTQQEVPGVVEG